MLFQVAFPKDSNIREGGNTYTCVAGPLPCVWVEFRSLLVTASRIRKKSIDACMLLHTHVNTDTHTHTRTRIWHWFVERATYAQKHAYLHGTDQYNCTHAQTHTHTQIRTNWSAQKRGNTLHPCYHFGHNKAATAAYLVQDSAAVIFGGE